MWWCIHFNPIQRPSWAKASETIGESSVPDAHIGTTSGGQLAWNLLLQGLVSVTLWGPGDRVTETFLGVTSNKFQDMILIDSWCAYNLNSSGGSLPLPGMSHLSPCVCLAAHGRWCSFWVHLGLQSPFLPKVASKVVYKMEALRAGHSLESHHMYNMELLKFGHHLIPTPTVQ